MKQLISYFWRQNLAVTSSGVRVRDGGRKEAKEEEEEEAKEEIIDSTKLLRH